MCEGRRFKAFLDKIHSTLPYSTVHNVQCMYGTIMFCGIPAQKFVFGNLTGVQLFSSN